jgi:hypothetical protein
MAWVRFQAVQNLSLLHSVWTGFGAHLAYYPMGAGDYFLGRGVKRQGRGSDQSPPSSAEVKNSRVIPPLPFPALRVVVVK